MQENGRLHRFLVGNTAGFGNLADGRPMWSGDFDGNGRADVLFYYPGDRNWWMGSLEGRVLQWRLVGNTAWFGNAYDGRPFFTGSFSRTDRAQVLFYFPGDHNWWLGTVNGGSLRWALAGNTYGFGPLTRGHKFYMGDFNGDRLTDVMFHYPTDGNWWLGSLAGDRLHWFLASNTKGFGNVSDGRPIWTGDFNGDSRADMLFYSPGDRNWWLGASVGFTLNWSLVDNTAGFGNLADGRPFFQGRFLRKL